MCGRYVLTTPGDVLAQLFDLPEAPAVSPRYNIAPTQPVPIVRAAAGGGRELALALWGLVPHWAKERALGAKLINARAETLAEKPAFRDALRRRRCLLPADGFYEWQAVERGKQPYLLRLPGGAPFALAGLWSRWSDPADPAAAPLETCTIVTTTPNEVARVLHDRMPVILPRESWPRWLDPAADTAALSSLLVPFAGALEAFPVSRRVNSPANEDPRCIEPAAAGG
jgi:putative SOS response-associated peptidase YedK